MAIKNKYVDWKSLEDDYRGNIKSMRQMVHDHGLYRSQIKQIAAEQGWGRDSPGRGYLKNEDRSLSLENEIDCSGYVYVIFIDTGVDKFYKIGISNNINNRLITHQCSSPFEIRVACAYFVGNMRREEHWLHERFGENRIRGEWFRLSRDDLTFIAGRSLLLNQ